VPRLEADLVAVRAVLEAERLARVAAEQSAAVLTAKLEADERTSKTDVIAAQITAKVETFTRDLVVSNTAVQAGQARFENATRELEAAKKVANLLKWRQKNGP
jgi:colicin import membrane protein